MRGSLAEQKLELAKRQAAWDAEKAEMEIALEEARNRPKTISAIEGPERVVQVTNQISPTQTLERLQTMRASTNSPRNARLIVHQFESLIEAGPGALPAIRQFLAQNVETEYESNARRGFRDGKIPTEFNFPPSLRLGLFETVKNIGGDAAQELLAETLKATGRGIEVTYLAYALQEMAPNKYRDVALNAARDLLAKPILASSGARWTNSTGIIYSES